jgi:predicted nuclease with RNAse H fold
VSIRVALRRRLHAADLFIQAVDAPKTAPRQRHARPAGAAQFRNASRLQPLRRRPIQIGLRLVAFWTGAV